MAAIIMPEAASLDRTQAVAEKVDAIFTKIPGVETRSMVTGYSLLDSGFKTNAGTFFVTLKDFKERYASTETAKAQNARAVLLHAFPRGAEHRDSDRRSGRAAADSRHRHHRRLRVLDPGHGRRRPGAARRGDAGIPAEGARAAELTSLDTTFRANTQQLRAIVDRDKAHAARRSDRGRLQRDPGAVRLADGEPVQPVQPRLVGDRAVGRASTGRTRAT